MPRWTRRMPTSPNCLKLAHLDTTRKPSCRYALTFTGPMRTKRSTASPAEEICSLFWWRTEPTCCSKWLRWAPSTLWSSLPSLPRSTAGMRTKTNWSWSSLSSPTARRLRSILPALPVQGVVFRLETSSCTCGRHSTRFSCAMQSSLQQIAVSRRR